MAELAVDQSTELDSPSGVTSVMQSLKATGRVHAVVIYNPMVPMVPMNPVSRAQVIFDEVAGGMNTRKDISDTDMSSHSISDPTLSIFDNNKNYQNAIINRDDGSNTGQVVLVDI